MSEGGKRGDEPQHRKGGNKKIKKRSESVVPIRRYSGTLFAKKGTLRQAPEEHGEKHKLY